MRIEGYGLNRVVKCDCRLADKSYLFQPSCYSWDGFSRFMKDRGINCSHFEISECVHYVECVEVLCISSPFKKFHKTPDKVNPRVSFLSDYYYTLTGRPVKFSSYAIFRQAYDDYINRSEAEKYGMEFTVTELANVLGFSNIDEAIRSVVPSIPNEICCLAEYLGLFKEPTGTQMLQHMILEY